MPAKELKVSAILPAYNEEDGVADVLKELGAMLARRAAAHEIIVVDDGSTDGTAAIAEKNGAKVVRHPVNGGYGRALISGLKAAEHDWILMADADGTYPALEAEKLFAHADCDMVVGARRGRVFWGSPLQAFLRWVYLWMAGFVVGEALPDANSGLRLFKKSVFLKTMPFLCLGYSFSTTMTLSFYSSGRFVKHVPIDYLPRKGRSKVRPLRDILRTMQIMTQVILYYNPLKLAIGYAGVLLAGAFAAFFYLGGSGRSAVAVLAFFWIAGLAVIAFLFGCLLDSLRMHRIDQRKLDALSNY